MARFTSPPDQFAYKQRVWQIVRQIPVGKVATYGQIAQMMPIPPGVDPAQYLAFGARWVGGAMAACPEDVPWQRVINSQGKISLPPAIAQHQRQLLESEGIVFDSRDRIDLSIYRWSGYPE